MKTFIITGMTAIALSLSSVAADAGGWGKRGSNSNSYSSGLVNVSPSVRTGNLNLLNGTSVLNGSPILSGNVVSGILSGNRTGIGNGILGGNRLGILGGNDHSSKYKVKKRGRR